MPAPATVSRQLSENDGLCSMYSSFTRSGPQTKSASVFGASTTSSISTPSSSASAWCSSTESTRTPRWLSSGRSEVARIALGQLEEGAADLEPSVAGGREAELLPAARRRLGIRGAQRDVVEVELGVGLRLDEHDLEPFAEVDHRLAAVERRRRAGRSAQARRARAGPRRRRASACRGARRRRAA